MQTRQPVQAGQPGVGDLSVADIKSSQAGQRVQMRKHRIAWPGNKKPDGFDDPGVGKLSKFVTAKLEEVARRHQADDEWDMVAVAQQLPEWRRNDPGDSSREIPLADILEAVGRGGDFDKIVELAQLDFNAAAFFSEAEPLRQAHPV